MAPTTPCSRFDFSEYEPSNRIWRCSFRGSVMLYPYRKRNLNTSHYEILYCKNTQKLFSTIIKLVFLLHSRVNSLQFLCWVHIYACEKALKCFFYRDCGSGDELWPRQDQGLPVSRASGPFTHQFWGWRQKPLNSIKSRVTLDSSVHLCRNLPFFWAIEAGFSF